MTTALALLLAVPGGSALGAALAAWLAPGSWFASAVGMFALPLAFVAGLQSWIGLAFLLVLPRFVLAALRGDWRSARPRGDTPLPSPPGYGIFVPIASAAGLAAGVLTAFTGARAIPSLAVWWAAGTAYGLMMRWFAGKGWLRWPDSM